MRTPPDPHRGGQHFENLISREATNQSMMISCLPFWWWPVMTTAFSVPSSRLQLQLQQYDATELSERLADGRLTSVELVTATLDYIDTINPSVNAIVSMRDRHLLLAEAAECDNSPRIRQGWLHGIPLAIKDNANVAGIRTTHGGSPLVDLIPARSDAYVRRLQEAGAIIIGKTNCPESCLGSHTVNPLFGATRHPLQLDRSAGGSSGGAAAAVASGMLAVADGSDMMGSLRNPAGWHGLYSHRPTAGWLATDMEIRYSPLPYPITTPGPLGKSVRDLVHMLETMVGDPTVFTAADVSLLQATTANNDDSDGVPRLLFRVAWLGSSSALDGCPYENGILSCCREALAALEGRGLCQVTDLTTEIISSSSSTTTTTTTTPPFVFATEKLWSSWQDIRSLFISRSLSSSFPDSILIGEKARVKKELQWEIARGKKLSDETIRSAQMIAQDWVEWLEQDVWPHFDALALPTAQVWPFDVSLDYPHVIDGVPMDTYHRWMQNMVPASLAGLPVTTIPAGTGGPDDLPMGLQLMGRRGDDAKLLAFAAYAATSGRT
jgi:amidase